jgi:hypothetical protein
VNDRPTVTELIEAVRKFIEDDVVPSAAGAQKYQARVAAHVLAMVERELASQDRHLRGEWTRLAALLEDEAPLPESRQEQEAGIRTRTEALVSRIRAGDADAGPFRSALLAHLRETVDDKLEVARGPLRGEQD